MKITTCSGLLLMAMLAHGPVASAKSATYRFDPVHSQVLFFASHLGFSRSMGRFPGLSGTFTYDPDDPSATRVDANIALSSLYLGDAAWQKKVLSRDFLAAESHPVAHFVSTRYERVGEKRGKLAGELTLRGVTKPVVLDVVENRVGRHSFSLDYVAGFSATATIDRSDFGMTRLLPAVGDTVEIRLEIEGIRDGTSRSSQSD
jgi:polyisoprenoid-binding protein YceI